MRVGTIVRLDDHIEEKFRDLVEMDMNTCQLNCWDEQLMTDEMAARIRAAMEKYGVEITAFWCGWDGPKVWDFYGGQETLGLVPVAFRDSRMHTLIHGSDFAKKLGVDKVVTHVGYMPENPHDPNYQGVLAALRLIVDHCIANGQDFLFETGQETPVTLLRAIQDLGEKGLGINLDPANLLMYGKANPVDSLDVFGKYVMGIHGKDGLYPTNGRELGREVPLGEGRVDFPRFIAKLKEIGYPGDITIEREIDGDEQRRDIIAAKALLEELIRG